MDTSTNRTRISLNVEQPIWDRLFTVAPLVVVGTREGDQYDLAPKHMVTPMGWQNYFGFVCTPRHSTYHNVKHTGVYSVSYPRPSQIVLASLAAAPRTNAAGDKPSLSLLPTFPAEIIDGVFLEDAYLFLECELDRIVDGFGENSLIIGRVVAAHADPDALRLSDGDDQALIYREALLAYLHPGRIATIRESVAFPLPAQFQH
jgi:flavin reductase (DIM6/NTAB) family NADH-FMN oxidoreductase RutF